MATVSAALAKAKVQWESMGPRIWFLASSPSTVEFADVLDPAAALAVLRKKKDIILLPGHSEAHEFADFCREVLGLDDSQIRFTDDTNTFMVESNHAGAATTIQNIMDTYPSDGETFMLYPRKLTNTMRKWLPRLQTQGLLVFGEGTPGLKHTSAAILHRHARALDELSLLEEIAPHIRVRRGFICSCVDELLKAYQALKAIPTDRPETEQMVRIRPLRATAGGQLILHSEQELRMYDFPVGDVVLENFVTDDAADMRQHVIVHFVANQQLEPLTISRSYQGVMLSVRSCQTTDAVRETISTWVDELLDKTRINASGVGTFEFVIDNDQPILINVTSGFTTEHFASLFCHNYCRKMRMFAWTFTPPENLDVWTFWYRLYDANLTFRPGKKRSTSGIFPLNFQKGRKSIFVAVADSDDAVFQLQQQADALLRDSPTEESLERVSLDADVRRIWCGSARPEYRRLTQRYNLPNRCIPLVRKDRDFVILPDHKLTREFWNLCKEVKQLGDDQVLWTSDEHFVMDDDVDDEMVARIKAIVTTNPKDKFTIVPYCVTANFERWSAQLSEIGVTVFGEDFEWVEKYGHKGILHRHMNSLQTPCIMEEVAPNIRVAKGYTCDTADELVEAYKLIGTETVVIKPVFGAAGEGIMFVNDVNILAGYDFPMGQVILEEFLALDRTNDGIVLSPAVHYLGNTLFGNGLVDQIMVGTGYAGWRRSEASKSFQETCSRAINKLLKHMQPRGPGGFDFLSVEGVPFLTDVNTGRFNGAHMPKLFNEMFAPDCTFYCFKFKPPPTLSASQFWFRMQSADIAFVPGESESGVFPLIYLRGLSGLYICLAKTDEECKNLCELAKSCLADRVPISRPSSPPPELVTTMRMTLIKNALALYTPDQSHYTALLIAGSQIVGLLSDVEAENMTRVLSATGGTIIDASGMIVAPGMVDPHVHVTGGGGEMGPASRTPALQLSQIVRAGTTTVVGVTGTDSVSRSMENLLTKVRAINQEGLTAYMWTGAYVLPPPTLTGSVMRDVCLIEQCIGVGEVAIADHRGSQPTVTDLERLASECRVAGLLANKAGVVHCHMGSNEQRLSSLRAAIKGSALPITAFYPTHMSRNRELANEGAQWIKDGGYVDFTARSAATVKALTRYFASGVNLDRVTISSDAGGSCPSYDDKGELLRYKMIESDSMLWLLKKLHLDMQWPLQRALPLFCKNAAEILKLPQKGRIGVGLDADIILMSAETLDLTYVFARGKLMLGPDHLEKGMFEQVDI